MGFTDLLSLYGPNIAGAGQPVGPSPAPMGVDPSDPAEKMGGQRGGFDWKALLAGGLGAVGAGLLGGKEGAGSFAANFANAKHQQNLQLREQEHQTQKAIADQAHKAWQEIQSADWSALPPELSHLSGKAQELNQKYITAIAKDSPGGVAISPKEAQEIIAISSVLRGAKEKVGAFQASETKANEAARPYAAGLTAGTLEPPPSVEGFLDSGLSESEAAQRGGRELYQQAELARQQYDTPAFDEELGTLVTPSQRVTMRGQTEATNRAMQLQAAREAAAAAAREASEEGRWARLQASQEGMNSRFAAALQDRRGRHEDMPIPVQSVDAQGNPITQFVRRGDIEQTLSGNGGQPVVFQKGRNLTDRKALTYLDETLRKIDELDALSDEDPSSVGGVFGWRGKLTGAKRDTGLGTTTDTQAALVTKSRTLVEEFARAKEGAVIPEAMLARLEKLVPAIGSPTFKQDLKRFKVEVARVRAEMGGGGGLTPPPTFEGRPGAGAKSDPLGILN
jgi:hypothetical protein